MTARTEPVRVLIVDDHPVVRDGLAAVLGSQPDLVVVGAAADGREALEQIRRLDPGVVLVDLQMPEMDGFATTAAIRADHPDVQVVVLTSYDTEADITAAMAAGAVGYLLKDADRDQLCAAVRAAARGQVVLSAGVAAKLMTRLRADAGGNLSGREVEVLGAVARGDSNRQIARRLHISEATVKTHLVHIYAKLGVEDRTAAVTTALAQGIIRLPRTGSSPSH